MDGHDGQAVREVGELRRRVAELEGLQAEHKQERGLRQEYEKALEESEEKRKRAEEALEARSRGLEEANTALTVLLERRDEERRALESRIVANVKELICPYLEKLRGTCLSDGQAALLDVVDSNLEDIISPFVQKMTTASLTPTEIQVANLIKDGKRSKEIARLLNVSMDTVDTHRNNIRKKLGIGGKKLNLHAHLLSL
ncbi:MAG: LuxR C-terminal-related transcriptional regulator [Syntrophorhabdales bacterium]|jgi:DNA-binding CsgD family transcriptional regulator